MSQTRLHVTAPRDAATRIYAGLEQAFEDEGFPLAILEVDETRDIHEVSLYVDDDELGRAEAEMRRLIGSTGATLALESEALPDIDWVARSLEGLKPVRAGRFFVHGAHDRTLSHVGAIAIEIEAGLAFGTGHHGTTAGCLEMIDRVVRRERPRNALDLGAGSAVLAIAVAKLGQIPVLATDIDPVAVRVARQNVRLNGASAYVQAVTATGLPPSGLRSQRAVRPDRRQHPRQAADAACAGDGAARRAGRIAHPVRHPRPPARRRRRRLCRAALPPCDDAAPRRLGHASSEAVS